MRRVGSGMTKTRWPTMAAGVLCKKRLPTALAHRVVFSKKKAASNEDLAVEIKPIETRDDARVGMAGGGLLRLAQRELRGVVDYLFEKGWRPNHITLASMGLSTLQGLAIFIFPASGIPLLTLPLVAGLRLLLDVADGLMARRYDLKTKTGAVLNEVEYIYSDVALYLPLALVPGVSVLGMTTVIGLTVATELVGIACRLIGKQRRFDGPLAKLSRTVWFSGAALAMGLGLSPQTYHWMDLYLGASVLLLSLTLGNRVSRAFLERTYTRGLGEVDECRDHHQEVLQAQALRVLDEFSELRTALFEDRKLEAATTLFNALQQRFEKHLAQRAQVLPGLVSQARSFTLRTRHLPPLDAHHAPFFSNVADGPVGEFASAADLQAALRESTRSEKPRRAFILVDSDSPTAIKNLREDLKTQSEFKPHDFDVQRFTAFCDTLVGKINSFAPNLVFLGGLFETLHPQESMQGFIGQLAAVMPAKGIVVASTVWQVDPIFYVQHARRQHGDLPVGLMRPNVPNKEVAQMFKDAGFEILEQKVTAHGRLCTYAFQKKKE